jgi:hypothetical protein
LAGVCPFAAIVPAALRNRPQDTIRTSKPCYGATRRQAEIHIRNPVRIAGQILRHYRRPPLKLFCKINNPPVVFTRRPFAGDMYSETTRRHTVKSAERILYYETTRQSQTPTYKTYYIALIKLLQKLDAMRNCPPVGRKYYILFCPRQSSR